MFRITQYMEELRNPSPLGPRRNPPGPVVIWNLIRRCNLLCKHCYSISADTNFKGELSTDEVYRVMEDLRAYGVPVLILSGGEPLLRPDIHDIGRRAKELGFYVGLSTNGTLIDGDNIGAIADVGFDYVGISLDGIGAVHDAFRRKEGAFDASMEGIRLCNEHGIKVGIRFCLTQDNDGDLEPVLDLLDSHDIDKFYLSHLNYSGRGNKNRRDDAHFQNTRRAMDTLFERSLSYLERGIRKEFVTGNNDADGVYLLQWAAERFPAERVAHLRAKLAQWGGNSSGVNISNIDNLGNVKERPFSEIWEDRSDPLMAGLKASPRRIGGRCGACAYFDVCGGNTRVRAREVHGDPWAEDPGCYLADDEVLNPLPQAAGA